MVFNFKRLITIETNVSISKSRFLINEVDTCYCNSHNYLDVG